MRHLIQTPCPYVNLMARTALKAGQKLIRDFRDVEYLTISSKGTQDFVTSADQAAEKIIFNELKRTYPDFSFVMEESGQIKGFQDLTFVVDPLDGTLNFLHGMPHFAISIGLLDKNQPLAGVIYDPIRDELFWASKGLGAFMNQRRLRVPQKSKPYTHLLGVGHAPPGLNRFLKTIPHVFHVRISGSAVLDLAYVAAGRLDIFIAQTLMPWDQSAATILLKEAGAITNATFTNLDSSQPLTFACAPWLEKYTAFFSNKEAHDR